MAETTQTQKTTPDAARRDAPATQKNEALSACCGGPAPAGTDACCARDAQVKSTGGAGCGCSSAPLPAPSAPKKTGFCG
jgi:hypothetical protein